VLLAYLDESSFDGRYYIGALGVHESNARALTGALDQIAVSASSSYGPPTRSGCTPTSSSTR
jgi:hypothetical protein